MLNTAPTLAIGGVHTAEDGPLRVRQVINKIYRIIGREKVRHAVAVAPDMAHFLTGATSLPPSQAAQLAAL